MSDMHTEQGGAEEAAPTPPPSQPELDAAPAPEPPPTPPEEIRQDVLGTLDEFDEAMGAGAGPIEVSTPEDPHAFDSALGLSSLGYDEVPQPRTPSAASPLMPRRRLESLDDVYVEFPQLRTGEYSLRIEREKPTKWGGRQCDGWIEDIEEYITMAEFRRTYGGGTYRVSVLGPETGGRADIAGRPPRRTLDHIKITIQGPPVLRDMANRDYGFGGGGLHPQVESKRLDIEGAERAAYREELKEKDRQILNLAASRQPDWQVVNEVAERQVEQLNRAHAESLGVLRQDLSEKLQTIRRLENSIEEHRKAYQDLEQKLKDEVYEERTKRIEASNKEESEKIRNLRAEHEREVQRIQQAHAEKVEAMHRDHQQRLQDTQDRAERLQRDNQDRQERAMEAEKREHARTVENLERRHAQEMEHARSMWESRLAEIERASQARIESIKETSASQLQSAQLTANVQTQSVNTVAQNQVQMANQQVETLRAELASARVTIQSLEEDLRSQHKGPLEAVTEATQLLDTLGLRGDKTESEDWRSQIAAVARNFTDKVPEIARQFAEVREHNRVANQQRAMPVHRPPHQMAGGPPQPAPRPAPIQRPRPMPPPGFDPDAGADPDAAPVGASPLGHSGVGAAPSYAPIGSAADDYPMYRPQPAVPQHPPQVQHPQAQPQQPTQQPVQQPQQQVQMGPPVQHEEAPQPPAEPTPQQEPSRPAMAMPQDYPTPQYEEPAPSQEPTEEQMQAATAFEDRAGELVDELEAAIKGGVIGPKLFADQFVKKAPDIAAALIANVDPQTFRLAIKESGSPHKAIHSRDGQKFIEDCWAEVARLTGGAA